MPDKGPLDDLTPAQEARTLLLDALDSLQNVHDQMREERAFVWKLEQYQNDLGNVRDRTRVQPRSQSIFRLLRYKAGQILKEQPYFKARSVDMLEDPKTAAYAKWALEHDVSDPRKRYEKVRRETVLAGLSSRIGCYHVGWSPDSGPFGEVEPRSVDGTKIAWEPPYTDPHDPRCGWFMEWGSMPISAIERMPGWKNTKDVEPDDGTDSGRPSTINRNGAVEFTDSRGEREPMRTQRSATVVMLWKRFGKPSTPTTTRELAPEERYMVAETGPMAGQPFDYQPPDGGELPESDILDDGTVLKRVDVAVTDEGRLGYPDGELIIAAPFSGAEGVLLYRGPWPQKMRFYPYVVWQPYGSPFEQISTSDVALNWTMTLVQNGTMRSWYEQIRAAKGIMVLPEVGISDYAGEPFTYTDANGVQAFYRGAPPTINYIPGPQPSNQIQSFLTYVGQELRAQEGSGDLTVAGGADQLKGIAVGTVEQAAKSGNVAIDDHIASFQMEEAVGLNVWHDIQRARWTQERWVRYLGPDGVDAFMRMRGADIPAADIVITTRPTLDSLNAEAIRGAVELATLAQQSPALARIVARRASMDPEDVAEILGEADMMRQQAMMAQAGQMNPGATSPAPVGMAPPVQ